MAFQCTWEKALNVTLTIKVHCSNANGPSNSLCSHDTNLLTCQSLTIQFDRLMTRYQALPKLFGISLLTIITSPKNATAPMFMWIIRLHASCSNNFTLISSIRRQKRSSNGKMNLAIWRLMQCRNHQCAFVDMFQPQTLQVQWLVYYRNTNDHRLACEW